ncbi:MAG TPA: hypothetical protein VHR66_09205 [Gemmataceae bacterium]|nr:hypothetical protein [Gemmataceae bacterium]
MGRRQSVRTGLLRTCCSPLTVGFYGVLMFTPEGKQIVASSEDGSLRFWDATTGDLVGAITLPRRPTNITFTPDGKLLAVAFSDPTVLISDVNAALKPAKESACIEIR